MSKHRTWFLVAMITGLVGCATNDDVNTSSTEQGSHGTDTLVVGDGLFPGEQISHGGTVLVYQGDNNLVLYQNGNAIWATFAALGTPPDEFEMQTDCNAVVYNASGPVWATNTFGKGSNCVAHVMEGDWYVCSGATRVFDANGGLGDCGSGVRPVNYLGCYVDTLPAFQGTASSFAQCVNACAIQGFALAGLRSGGNCFCSSSQLRTRVDDAECNMPCPVGGGPCGSPSRTSVYRTGIVPGF
jgi:WSC domain-containing protein